MKKNAQRILSGILAALILSVAAFPVYAVPTGSPLYDTIDFYTYVYGIYKGWREGHPDTDYSQYPGFRGGGFGSDPDRVGGGSFSKDESKTAYDNYVETLPVQGYDSDGGLLYSPPHGYFQFSFYIGGGKSSFGCEHSSFSVVESSKNFSLSLDCASNSFCVFPGTGQSTFRGLTANIFYNCTVPIDGFYTLASTQGVTGYYLDEFDVRHSLNKVWSSASSLLHYSAGAAFVRHIEVPSFSSVNQLCKFASVQGFSPVFRITPDSALSGDIYNVNTRPTSITGGNYGIVGDNGQITKVEDNSTIVNETNNTYYNPATGTTVPITNWSYDYSDRSYKVTLESGDTVTITYGDENITIKEGDTVYNIYYLIEGSGSETPVDPPGLCEHTWAETSTMAPTCTLPGSKLSTCSKCQQTKKEAIPALGHDWQVKQTVTTEYDESGQLTQQGYTIFECSRCHEQYKSTDGTIPPGGGSGTDPGEEGETIWDKLGKLIGAIGKGLIDVVEAVFGKILDALISLVEMMAEKIGVVVETILSMFDELPAIFNGFLAFLTALFPFLPPELMTILTFGVLAVVFIGIIKAVRR